MEISLTEKMAGQEELDVVPVEAPTVEVKLFGKWSSDEVHVNDISLAVSVLYRRSLQSVIRGLLCAGLHHCEGEGICVFAPYSWKVCIEEIQKGSCKCNYSI